MCIAVCCGQWLFCKAYTPTPKEALQYVHKKKKSNWKQHKDSAFPMLTDKHMQHDMVLYVTWPRICFTSSLSTGD